MDEAMNSIRRSCRARSCVQIRSSRSCPDPPAVVADLAGVAAAEAAHLDHGGGEAAREQRLVAPELGDPRQGPGRVERGVGLEHGAVGEHVGVVAGVEAVLATDVEGSDVVGVVVALRQGGRGEEGERPSALRSGGAAVALAEQCLMTL